MSKNTERKEKKDKRERGKNKKENAATKIHFQKQL
jgi:hypothetical protein